MFDFGAIPTEIMFKMVMAENDWVIILQTAMQLFYIQMKYITIYKMKIM